MKTVFFINFSTSLAKIIIYNKTYNVIFITVDTIVK